MNLVFANRLKFGGIENYESKNNIGNRRRFIGKS
jgi:hypothetical protein